MSEYYLLANNQQPTNSSVAKNFNSDRATAKLAATITRDASTQTYYTIRFLVDRPLVADAYRAYAYFRWVDDYVDQENLTQTERTAFVARQRMIIAHTYRGERVDNLTDEERLVVDLITNDGAKSSGLRAYIDNMMAVMAYDANRRGRLITGKELTNYTMWLATAVTEALHHFIGHGCAAPQNESRYLAVTAAHITHMLRDAIEDIAAGYYNSPQEFLVAHEIDARDVTSDAYRAWVQSQVQLARQYFQAGKAYLAHVESTRCRIAGYAYIARFEVMLDIIEKDGYRLRANYPERKSGHAALKMSWAALSQAFKPVKTTHHPLPAINAIVGKETIQ